jgi:uncharacterized membrane protein YqiK
VLDGPAEKKSARKEVRWYVDPQGKRYTTLKEFDPYGRRTHPVGCNGDPLFPSDPNAAIADLEARVNGSAATTREAAARAEAVAVAAAAAANEAAAGATAEARRLSQAVESLQRAEMGRAEREADTVSRAAAAAAAAVLAEAEAKAKVEREEALAEANRLQQERTQRRADNPDATGMSDDEGA